MDTQPNSMHLAKVTLQDASLTHQVRFSTRRGTTAVSCNCRATLGNHSKAGKIFYDPMGESKDLAGARELYNNPDNHNAPFTEGDRAKW